MGEVCVLDNIVWHAVSGEQGQLAERQGRAGRFDPEVSPFAALSDLGSPEAWADLGGIVGPGTAAVLFAAHVPVPDGWTADMRIGCVQMVATDVVVEATDAGVIELGPDDIDDMTELVEATRPGPFGRRTIELGRYVGIREEGRLCAMAGERFKAPGFTEISMVCTAEAVRGRGLGRVVTLAMVDSIRRRGDEAMLHVVGDNAPAIALYEKIGFSERTKAEAVVVRNVGES